MMQPCASYGVTHRSVTLTDDEKYDYVKTVSIKDQAYSEECDIDETYAEIHN